MSETILVTADGAERLTKLPETFSSASRRRQRVLARPPGPGSQADAVREAVVIAVTPLDHADDRPRRVALGFFDGVHRGHRETIRGCDTVLTFDPHPREVLTRGASASPRLSSLSRRAELLEEIGVQELVVVTFDMARALQAPEDFVDEVLIDSLQASHVSVGASFRFGHRASGTPSSLIADGRFSVRVADTLIVGGEPVSSTRIRRLISQGEVAAAAVLLGSSPTMDVTVGTDTELLSAADNRLVTIAPGTCLPPPGRYPCSIAGHPNEITVPDRSRPGDGIVVARTECPLQARPGTTVRVHLETDPASAIAGRRRQGAAHDASAGPPSPISSV